MIAGDKRQGCEGPLSRWYGDRHFCITQLPVFISACIHKFNLETLLNLPFNERWHRMKHNQRHLRVFSLDLEK